MTEKSIKNVGASVKARLLNLAKQLGVEFNRILLLYLQERFLYRLSKSRYKDRFILKGGVLFYGIHQEKAMPTKDIDLLVRNLPNSPNQFLPFVLEIFSIEAQDGIHFQLDSITIDRIVKIAQYEGLRIKFTATLDTAILRLQVDIGFSDKVTPHPIIFEYPVLIGKEKIKLLAYSWESVIAEKVEAIVKLGELNSRMKDFYDIYFLQQQKDLSGTELKIAIKLTFENRETEIEDVREIFSESFIKNKKKQIQWKAFLTKNDFSVTESFKDVMISIRKFIEPIVITIINDKQFQFFWDSSIQSWINRK